MDITSHKQSIKKRFKQETFRNYKNKKK